MKRFYVLTSVVMLAAGVFFPVHGDVGLKMGTKVFTRMGMNMTTVLPHIDSLKYTLSDMFTGVSPLSRMNLTATVDGKKRAFVEIRPTGAIIEQLYGTAELGPGGIIAGKTESIFNLVWGRTGSPLSPLFIGWGKAWAGRVAQVQYLVPVATGAFKFALCSPNADSVGGIGLVGNIPQHAAFPQVQFAFGQNFGLFSFELSGLYNTTSANEDEVDDELEDASSTAVGIAGFTKVGISLIAITIDGYYGQNIGFANAIGGFGPVYGDTIMGGTDYELYNASGYGGFMDVQLSFAPFFVKGGLGLDAGDYADMENAATANTAYFVSAGCSVSPNMSLGVEYNAAQTKANWTGEDETYYQKSAISVFAAFAL